jgi:hypothetical protein
MVAIAELAHCYVQHVTGVLAFLHEGVDINIGGKHSVST